MVTDPIGDFIIQIKNANVVKKDTIDVPYSKVKYAIAKQLMALGYIKRAEKIDTKFPSLRVGLVYNDKGRPRITHTRRVSSPGHRIYYSVNDIRSRYRERGDMFFTTPKGILSAKSAYKSRVGGEALFIIW